MNKGQSLIELLIALGVFVLGVVTIGLLIIDAGVSSRQAGERTQAVLLAKEGLEAARSIRDDDFANLIDGTHGIAISANTWIFSDSEDITNIFKRRITVSTVDADTKKITSTVVWREPPERPGSTTLITYLTNWVAPITKAGNMIVDVTGANIGGKGFKDLLGITIENTGSTNIVIDRITVIWNNKRRIEEIVMDGIKVWSGKGPGTPLRRQPSGTILDIQDFTLTAGSGIKNIDRFRFSGNMTGVTFDITFTMVDGSTKSTGSFTP